jgi:hypothetical protein
MACPAFMRVHLLLLSAYGDHEAQKLANKKVKKH